MDFPTQLFIDGEWRDALSGRRFDVVNPATGELVASVSDAGPDDVTLMIDAAERAQSLWAALPAVERGQIMKRAARLFEERIDHLAELLTREQGKPVEQARGEIRYGLGFIDWFGEEARRAYGTTIPATTGNKRIFTIKQPIGITACITPWNFPAVQILRKLGAALAAGCTMIVKPAALTPLTALEIARVFSDAGLPPGVLQVAAAGNARPIGDALMGDTRVQLVSFTGSTAVGKILMRAAADTVKKVSLELGGHAPFIVFDDADLDLAVSEAMAVKMRNMGQTCVSANRFYVHEKVLAEFTARLRRAFAELVIGNGLDPSTTVGPLIDEGAVAKVEEHVNDAVSKGATVVIGGRRPEGVASSLYYEPTIIAGVDESMIVATEETFGPLAPIFTFTDDDDVVARANDSEYGLAAYFFTRDLNRVISVGEGLEYGTVGVNDASISAVQAPFGGVKESGLGREGGALGMDEYLEVKYLSVGGL